MKESPVSIIPCVTNNVECKNKSIVFMSKIVYECSQLGNQKKRFERSYKITVPGLIFLLKEIKLSAEHYTYNKNNQIYFIYRVT